VKARSKKRFLVRRHRVEVEFHHIDMMKIVHNAQYLKWFEKGRFDVIDAMFQDDGAQKEQLVTPVVMNHCIYLKPARLGDTLVVTTHHPVEERWTGRFRFEHSVSNAKTKVELATGKSEITVVDALTFRPMRNLPETIWNCYKKLR
jgi:acyl-CoA thioester hydrolase